MSLLALRKEFVEFTGRYDLITDPVSFADKGADKFIRAGQRWLDRTFELASKNASYYTTLAIGDWYKLLPTIRTIRSIWMSNDTNGRWELEPRSVGELLDCTTTDLAATNHGQPLFYAHKPLRTIPESLITITVDEFGNNDYTVGDVDDPYAHYNYNGIIWTPPLATASNLEVSGNFLNVTLTANNDKNYWTEQEPHVLVMAACRALEQSMRNFEGVRDWENNIKGDIIGLEFDLADQESEGLQQMRG